MAPWLRPLAVADMEVVAGLQLDPHETLFAGGTPETIVRSLRSTRYSDAYHCFAVMSDLLAVGFFVLREAPALPEWAPQDVVTLHHYRIGKAHQRLGYGKAGLSLAAAWIVQNRPAIDRLMLSVNTRNQTARELYLKCGFYDTGALFRGSLGDQHILAVRVCKLATAA